MLSVAYSLMIPVQLSWGNVVNNFQVYSVCCPMRKMLFSYKCSYDHNWTIFLIKNNCKEAGIVKHALLYTSHEELIKSLHFAILNLDMSRTQVWLYWKWHYSVEYLRYHNKSVLISITQISVIRPHRIQTLHHIVGNSISFNRLPIPCILLPPINICYTSTVPILHPAPLQISSCMMNYEFLYKIPANLMML